MFDIVVVGDINADLILSGDVTPEYGQIEKLIDDATLTIGSSGAIFACGAARLGLRVSLIGKVGDDVFGRYMQQALSERDVDTSALVIDPNVKTGLSVIFSHGNDRAILTYSGSISALRFDEINTSLFSHARHLHLTSYYLQTKLQPDIPALLQAAHHAGTSISLDTNYDPEEKWDGGLAEVLKMVDVFLPNETELHAISGIPYTDLALEELSKRIPVIAVKMGARGGLARRGSERVVTGSLSVKVIDTTGAGDSFDGGFLYGYLSGWDLADSLRLACACGSLSTRAAGGTSAQPTLIEALEAIEAG